MGTARSWDGFSIAGFVVSLCGLVLGLVAVGGLILGAVGLTRTGPGADRGRGLAVTAVVLSGVTIVAGLAVLLGAVTVAVTADLEDERAAADRAADDGAADDGTERDADPDLDGESPGPVPSEPADPDGRPSPPGGEPDPDFPPDRRTLAEVRVGNCMAEFPQATPAGYSSAAGTVPPAGTVPVSDTVWDVVVVPCAGPHVYEIFDEYEMSSTAGDAWPGLDVADAIAYEGCLARFDDATAARSVAPAGLGVDVLYPTEDGWADGDRWVTCMIYDLAGGELVGGPLLSDRDPG